MSVNLQNTILSFELPPPEGNWENIAQRLDQEYDQSEVKVSEIFSNLSLTPPAQAWDVIASAIGNKAPEVKKISADQPSKVVPLFRRKWMSAAVTTGLVLLAALSYFLRPNGTPKNPTDSSKIGIAKTESLPSEAIAADAIGPLAGLIPQLVSPNVEKINNEPVEILDTVITSLADLPTTESEPEILALAKNTVQPVKTSHEVRVSAPAIRDQAGNIILNLDLLTAMSANYISVTGPNGEQTRVSSKFARYLAFMNENSEEEDDYIDFLFKQSGTWRQRFSDWRSKLAEQSAFAPSNAFFFDILELKELIKD